MPTAVITGANRGIGRETARQLLARGYRVYLGTQDPRLHGQSVGELGGDGFWLTIDVSDDRSIQQAAGWLSERETAVDVLINNAGIYPDGASTILDVSRQQLLDTFQTNTFGPIMVTQAILPLLRRSTSARVINISSSYGALEGLSPNVPSYCLSKLAINGFTIMLAEKLEDAGISVYSANPGWVRTDMGGANAARSVEDGAAGIVWLATEAPPGATGGFFYDGQPVAW